MMDASNCNPSLRRACPARYTGEQLDDPGCPELSVAMLAGLLVGVLRSVRLEHVEASCEWS